MNQAVETPGGSVEVTTPILTIVVTTGLQGPPGPVGPPGDGGFISVLEPRFGISADESVECSDGIIAAFAAADAVNAVLVIPQREYKVSKRIPFYTGARILSEGAVFNVLQDHTATTIGLWFGDQFGATANNVRVWGDLTVYCSNAIIRHGVYGLVSFFNSDDIHFQELTCGKIGVAGSGGESTGTFSSNSSRVTIDLLRCHETLADGSHWSRASRKIHVGYYQATNTGDDAFAVISVRQDTGGPIYDQCSDITLGGYDIDGFTGPTGGGLSFGGARIVNVGDGAINGSPSASISVSNYNQGGNYQPSNVNIGLATITNCPAVSGSVRVGQAISTKLEVDISNCFGGVIIIQSSTDTKVKNSVINTTGAAQVAVFDDNTCSNTLVSGSNLTGNAGGPTLLQGTGSAQKANLP